ncbi:hypothetical protein B0H15DRAFT_947925 [Mycena belliarum]|uniref:Uncharacterized protein n=1 Tax=Mycena belliarum TaxID=1033014 RepID=A0AAD6U656_9AGAR|nr:hypothetical protein B0H15DRAFT_947925 [Mycena belliae]
MPQPARLLLASCKDHSTQRTSTRRATDERLSPQVDGCWCRPSSQLSSRNSPPPPPPARRLRPSHAAHASTLATPSLQVGGGVVHTLRVMRVHRPVVARPHSRTRTGVLNSRKAHTTP